MPLSPAKKVLGQASLLLALSQASFQTRWARGAGAQSFKIGVRLLWCPGSRPRPARAPCLEAVMFGAHLWCAVTPSGQAEALTHEPPPRVTSPRGQLTLLHQPPLPAYVPAPDVDAHRSSLQPLAWTAARWAARPMYSTARPSSMAHTPFAPAPNSTGTGGLPRPSGFKLYHAIVGCIDSGQDCGYVFVGFALLLFWALFIAYVACRHRQTMHNACVSGCANPCAEPRQSSSPPVSPRLGPSKA